MRLGKRAVRRLVVLSVLAAAFLYLGTATWVEERGLDAQRASRVPAELQSAPHLDGESLLATVKTLASPEYEGRRTGTAGGIKARRWIADRMQAIGLESFGGKYVFPLSFTHSSIKGLVSPNGQYRTEYSDAANVLGLCKGTAAAPEAIVMSAHYDHLGVRDGAMYPGADDNASGVAVMLATAEQCRRSPFRHDVVFAAFDGEELGLQGAKAFLAAPPIPRERIGLEVNLDMVSRSDRRELFAAGTYHWPQTKPALEQVARRAPIKLLFGHDKPVSIAGRVEDWTNASDHGPFNTAKIPFVYFGVEDHADYHQPSDTADKINPMFFREAAETILDAVITLDAAMPFNR
ncbi:MAG TPA: M20/M25/M40 family metallo-hydrolase [Vicinamibacterales bacterium]|nr:M20/M25/M40 family metallo-hydrolase [Vicinamibacterales bacterium]